MLSLFGYDPDGDHYRITREQGTRRINLAIPEESMLVEKAIGAVPHSGGKLFSKGSDHWNTLVDWLKDGANKDPEDIAKPTKIELFPPSLLLEGNGSTQQMTVLASYSDGTTRDITPLTVCHGLILLKTKKACVHLRRQHASRENLIHYSMPIYQ